MTKTFGKFSVTQQTIRYHTFHDADSPGWHHYLDITDDKFKKLSDIVRSAINPDHIYFYFGLDYDIYKVKPAGGLESVPNPTLLNNGNLGWVSYSDSWGNISGDASSSRTITTPKVHVHSWKQYVGFTHVDYYCTECNEKRETLP